jgi:hypothetical protein
LAQSPDPHVVHGAADVGEVVLEAELGVCTPITASRLCRDDLARPGGHGARRPPVLG